MLKINRLFSSKIEKIMGRMVLDSRGLPTVEAEIKTNRGNFRAIVPSGASTGKYEAYELRDNQQQFHGKGVDQAISNINNIINPKLTGMDVLDQFEIDKIMVEELDGSKNQYGWTKEKLGANAILPVSMALARAGANELEIPLFQYIGKLAGNDQFKLPIPAFNVINGGRHAGNKLEFQEFMLIPSGASNFKEGVRMGSEIYWKLKEIIQKQFGKQGTCVGDEGGFAPDIENERVALDLITQSIQESGYEKEVQIGLDVAASEFYKNKKYNLQNKKLSTQEMIDLYQQLIQEYNIISIEDPLEENDFAGWAEMTKQIKNTMIIGDDLLVTNPQRIRMAIDPPACNSLLLKLNQIGSLYESIQSCNLAQNNKWNVMISHRSGDTEDHFIADLAVGLNANYIKSGATCRSERTSKYNQLIRIEELLENKGKQIIQQFNDEILNFCISFCFGEVVRVSEEDTKILQFYVNPFCQFCDEFADVPEYHEILLHFRGLVNNFFELGTFQGKKHNKKTLLLINRYLLQYDRRVGAGVRSREGDNFQFKTQKNCKLQSSCLKNYQF